MWDPWADQQASEGLRGRLQWFLLGRVTVISCFLGVVALVYLRSGENAYSIPVRSLLFIIIGTYVFSMVSAVVLQRIRRLDVYTYLQIAFDIALITGVVFFTGGIASPFPFLYSLPILNGAGLLFSRGALFSAALSALAYDGLMGCIAVGWVKVLHPFAPSGFDLQSALRLLTTNLTFFLIAYLANVLARRLHAMETLMLERQAERDRLELLQDALSRTTGSGLITTDADGDVTSVDRIAERLAGLPADEIIGRDLGSLFPPLRLSPSARLRLLQSAGAIEPIEFSHILGGDGSTAYLRCTAAPLRDTYGHPIGGLWVFQDVTRLKEIEHSRPIPETEDLRDELEAAAEIAEATDGLYGVSPAITQVRKMIERVAAADTTVLITGESGTGKELVARAIHAHSRRRDRPFVALNCGAMPESLIESELFGHVKGAFTGAVADRPGCFRVADSGTIFLDEIGDLPLPLQVKLLRVLQERVFRPVGSETTVAVDVRVIAATNHDLEEDVRKGRFRDDLFYRLNVITIPIPPLRQRREDIPLLIRHFLRQYSETHGRHVNRFSVGAGRILLAYEYPGNVRELENVVEHAVAMCDPDGDTATEEHLPAHIRNQHGTAHASRPDAAFSMQHDSGRPHPKIAPDFDLDEDLATYEKRILSQALHQAGGVKKRAAEILGINYRSLRHRLQKYGIDPTPQGH